MKFNGKFIISVTSVVLAAACGKPTTTKVCEKSAESAAQASQGASVDKKALTKTCETAFKAALKDKACAEATKKAQSCIEKQSTEEVRTAGNECVTNFVKEATESQCDSKKVEEVANQMGGSATKNDPSPEPTNDPGTNPGTDPTNTVVDASALISKIVEVPADVQDGNVQGFDSSKFKGLAAALDTDDIKNNTVNYDPIKSKNLAKQAVVVLTQGDLKADADNTAVVGQVIVGVVNDMNKAREKKDNNATYSNVNFADMLLVQTVLKELQAVNIIQGDAAKSILDNVKKDVDPAVVDKLETGGSAKKVNEKVDEAMSATSEE